MATTAQEEGVLKLIHPGRHVEIHLEPILAAEVMKRNPRHSVTRPDVFEFPWLVVKPESILVPGKVFFIVPNRTIYKLTKEYETRKRSSQASAADVTTNTKHQNHSQGLRKPLQALCLYQASPSSREQEHGSSGQSSSRPSQELVLQKPLKQKHQNQCQGLKNPVQGSCWNPATASPGPREHDLEKRVKRQSQVGCWPETIAKERNHRTSMAGSSAQIGSSSQSTRNGEKSTALVIYGDAGSKSSGLKSCLRRHDSARKHTKRVTFAGEVIETSCKTHPFILVKREDLYQLKKFQKNQLKTIPETEDL